MISNYRKIRKNLKQILPKNITVFPGRSLDEKQQRNFLVLIDLILSSDGNLAQSEEVIKDLGYYFLSAKDSYLITYSKHIPSVIRWYIDKFEMGISKYLPNRDMISLYHVTKKGNKIFEIWCWCDVKVFDKCKDLETEILAQDLPIEFIYI